MIRIVAERYREAFSGLPREIWFLSLVMLVNRAGSMVMPFLSLYVSDGLGMGDQAAGWIMGFFGLGSCVGSFVGGFVSERFGPFRVQIVSLVMNAIGFMLLSQMTSFWSIAIAIFSTSVVADAFRPANGAAITLLAPPELHTKAFALNRLAVNLGFTVGPLVGGFLATISYQFLFWIDAITCLAAAAVFVALLGQHMPDHTNPKEPELDGEMEASPVWPWANSKFIVFMILTFATFCVFFQLLSTFPLFLDDEYGLSKIQIGLLWAINTIVVVVFEMVLIQSLIQRSVLRIIAWGSFLMCIGFGVLPFGNGFWYALFTVMIWTVGEMLGMPQMFAYVASISTRRTRSLYIGFHTTCVAIALSVGPLIGTNLYNRDHYNCWHFATVIGFLVLVGFYALEWVDRSRKAISIDLTPDTQPSDSKGAHSHV